MPEQLTQILIGYLVLFALILGSGLFWLGIRLLVFLKVDWLLLALPAWLLLESGKSLLAAVCLAAMFRPLVMTPDSRSFSFSPNAVAHRQARPEEKSDE